MPTLGQELRKKREERGSSLKDIANRTKIGLRLLQALEDDRHDLLPEMFFLKGVLRSYVQAIGADEAYFMNLLAKVTAAPALEEIDAAPDVRPKRRGKILRIAAIVAGLAIVAAAGYIFLKGRAVPARRATPAPVIGRPAVEAPAVRDDKSEAAPAAANPNSQAESKTDKASAVPPAVPAPPLNLEMRFSAETWMIVDADGARVYEGTHKAGETAAFTARKEIRLQVGNAGGFALKLNGKAARPLGTPGAVLTDVRITPETLASFLEPAAGGPAGR